MFARWTGALLIGASIGAGMALLLVVLVDQRAGSGDPLGTLMDGMSWGLFVGLLAAVFAYVVRSAVLTAQDIAYRREHGRWPV